MALFVFRYNEFEQDHLHFIAHTEKFPLIIIGHTTIEINVWSIIAMPVLPFSCYCFSKESLCISRLCHLMQNPGGVMDTSQVYLSILLQPQKAL
jgi:hypothetical protein